MNWEHLRERCVFACSSHIMPGIHPSFKIDTQYGNHHPGFTEFTSKPHNLETARVAGKTVAMTALDLMHKPELVAAAMETVGRAAVAMGMAVSAVERKGMAAVAELKAEEADGWALQAEPWAEPQAVVAMG